MILSNVVNRSRQYCNINCAVCIAFLVLEGQQLSYFCRLQVQLLQVSLFQDTQKIQKVEKLLQILYKRDSGLVSAFYKALVENDQLHVALMFGYKGLHLYYVDIPYPLSLVQFKVVRCTTWTSEVQKFRQIRSLFLNNSVETDFSVCHLQ